MTIRKISNILFVCIIYFILFRINAYATNGLMFSGKIINEEKEKILVVKNYEVFIRYIDGDKFAYSIADDKCYYLENDITVCVDDHKVKSIQGLFHNVLNDDRLYKKTYNDLFFNEKNTVCDIMKFDVIYNLFVRNITIEAFETQLYIPDFFSILRLIIYHNLNTNDDKMYAFILSDKNEVGCVPYYEYIQYKPKMEDDNEKKIKKQKKKNIKAQTQEELLKIASEGAYKLMLLKNYVYLQPIKSSKNIENIVLTIHNNEVVYLNAIGINFSWQLFDGEYFYTKYKERLNTNNENGKNKNDNNQKMNKNKKRRSR